MRCNNCGWNNPDGLTACEKCSLPLQNDSTAGSSDQDVRTKPANAEKGDGDAPGISGTAMGRKSSMPAWDANNPPPTKPASEPASQRKMKVCPNPECRYQNDIKASTCVNCGVSLADNPESPNPAPPKKLKVEEPPVVVRPEKEAKKQEQPFGGTISPWTKAKHKQFSLRPIPRDGEQMNIKIEFDGEQVELNRENLEPKNNTITSKVQAVIEYKEGAWYISNKSTQQTTFVKIQDGFKLSKGDIILMGDRLFEFDE